MPMIGVRQCRRVVWLHWPIDDPAALQGDEAEITAGFRACRDELKGRIEQFVAEL